MNESEKEEKRFKGMKELICDKIPEKTFEFLKNPKPKY